MIGPGLPHESDGFALELTYNYGVYECVLLRGPLPSARSHSLPRAGDAQTNAATTSVTLPSPPRAHWSARGPRAGRSWRARLLRSLASSRRAPTGAQERAEAHRSFTRARARTQLPLQAGGDIRAQGAISLRVTERGGPGEVGQFLAQGARAPTGRCSLAGPRAAQTLGMNLYRRDETSAEVGFGDDQVHRHSCARGAQR
jgi:hypothetical protein